MALWVWLKSGCSWAAVKLRGAPVDSTLCLRPPSRILTSMCSVSNSRVIKWQNCSKFKLVPMSAFSSDCSSNVSTFRSACLSRYICLFDRTIAVLASARSKPVSPSSIIALWSCAGFTTPVLVVSICGYIAVVVGAAVKR